MKGSFKGDYIGSPNRRPFATSHKEFTWTFLSKTSLPGDHQNQNMFIRSYNFWGSYIGGSNQFIEFAHFTMFLLAAFLACLGSDITHA